MTPTKYTKLKNELQRLHDHIKEEVGSSTMDLINQLIEMELLLAEGANNQ